jgi:hypothetical protein
VKDLGEATYILGINIYIDKSKRVIGLSQDTYIDKVLKWFNMECPRKSYCLCHMVCALVINIVLQQLMSGSA